MAHIVLHYRRFQAAVVTGAIGTYALGSVTKNNQARPLRRATWYNVQGQVHDMKMLHRGRRALKPGKRITPGDVAGRLSRGMGTAMFKLLYKPVAIVAWIVGGVLSGLIFKNLWKVVGRGSDPPAPLDSERGWGEILLAAGVHGAIYALVKTAVDRGAAEWTRKTTGIWPDGTLHHPDRSPDHHEA